MTHSHHTTHFFSRLAGIVGLLFVLHGVGLLISVAAANCQSEAGAPACGRVQDAGSSLRVEIRGRHVGNPIDVVSGNKYQRAFDYRAVDSPLEFTRHYNSNLTGYDLGLGRGWRHTYDVSLSALENGGFQIVQSDGRRIVFAEEVSDVAVNTDLSPLLAHRAESTADGFLHAGESYRWFIPDGRRLEFNGPKLVRIVYPDAQEINLRYKKNLLASVTDSRGNAVHIHREKGNVGLPSWQEADSDAAVPTPSGHIASIKLTSGQRVNYTYDQHLNLISAIDEQGAGERYEFADAAWPNHLTTQRTGSGNQLGQWGYDEIGRANSWASTDATKALRINYKHNANFDTKGITDVLYANGAVDRYQWALDSQGYVFNVVQRARIANASSPRTTLLTETTRASQARTVNEELAVDQEQRVHLSLTDADSVDLILSLDRLGQIRDVRIGNRRFLDYEQAAEDGSLNFCLPFTPALSLDEKIQLWSERLDNDPDETGVPRCAEDAALLFVLRQRAAEQLAEHATGGIQRRSTQIGQPGAACPLPSMTSCNELLEDLEHAQMAECAYRRGSCDARWQPVSPASIGIAPELFFVWRFPCRAVL